MDQHRTRIVVGEGQTLRRGLLRFVLEGEGHEVVAEAGSSAELARMVAVHEPDVVVLDDGIGATAVQMARELAPKAKVVLVWPGAVVPIGGDARVEPAEVLKELGEAVRRVTTAAPGSGETIQKPAWIDRVRKDPTTLRDLLEKSGGLPRRPSVTELQRRGQRLHPTGNREDDREGADREGAGVGDEAAKAEPAAPSSDDAERPTAPVVILPVPGAGTDEPIVVVDAPGSTAATDDDASAPTADEPSTAPGADDDRSRQAAVIALPLAGGRAAGPEASPAAAGALRDPAEVPRDDAATEWNRRLGSIALGGAAVAGALVLALSLGGSRVPTDVLAANPPFPPGAEAPVPFDGIDGIADPDGIAGDVPGAPTLAPVPPAPADVTDVAPDRDDTAPPPTQTPPTEPPEPPPTPPEPPEPPPGGNGGNGGLPGASARNPHGGPPGLTGNAPATPANPGPGSDPGNGNGGGNGVGNGPPADPPGQGRGASERSTHAHKR